LLINSNVSVQSLPIAPQQNQQHMQVFELAASTSGSGAAKPPQDSPNFSFFDVNKTNFSAEQFEGEMDNIARMLEEKKITYASN
jgi:hypothetical protein